MRKSHLKVLAPMFSLILMLFYGFFYISADDYLSVSYGGIKEPPAYSFYSVIPFDNSNVCEDFSFLSSSQQSYIYSISISNYPDIKDDFNISFIDTDGTVFVGKGIWVMKSGDSINLYGSSAVSGAGLYELTIDGSLTFLTETKININIKSIFFYMYAYGGTDRFENVDINSIDCEFEPDTFQIKVESSNVDAGTVSGSVSDLKLGDEFTISTTTNPGYLFEYWELEITVNDGDTEIVQAADNPQHFTLSSLDPIIGNSIGTDAKYGQIIAVAHYKSLDVPSPTPSDPEHNITNNQDQSNEIDATISWGNGVSGDGSSGSIAYLVNDYYNLYALHFDGMAELENKTGWICELKGGNEYECSWNTNHISIYAFSDGSLFLYVYDHSTLQAKGSNLVVATSALDLYTWPQAFVQLDLLAAFITGDGVISRDTSSFDLTYVDDTLSYVYDEQLIIELLKSYNTAYDSTGTITYLGQKCVSSKTVYGTSSSAYFINTSSGTLSFYFAISDTMDTFQDIYIRFNQALTQNKQDETNEHLNTIIQDLNDLNNLVENGNHESQQASNYLDTTKGQFDDSLKNLEGVETDFMTDFTEAIGNLDISFDLGNNQDFVKSANWVKTQFDKLTTDNPFGILILFSLCVGICLLILGKRL